MAGVGEVGSVFFDRFSIVKEKLIDTFFDFVDILVVEDGDRDDVLRQLVTLNGLREVGFIEQNDTVGHVTECQQVSILLG